MIKKETIILTASNKDRRKINNQIREELIKKGVLEKGKEFILQDKLEPAIIKEFSKGDKVIFLKNDNRLSVKNGQTGTIQDIKDTILTVKSGDKTVVIDTNNYSKIDHGYAMTTHKAQGITVDRVLINLDSNQAQMNTRNAFYVDISRARHEVKIFTDDKAKLKNKLKSLLIKLTQSLTLEHYQPKNTLCHKIKASVETFSVKCVKIILKGQPRLADRPALTVPILQRGWRDLALAEQACGQGRRAVSRQ